MIISASRRTDIPSYYFPWFLNRVKAGYACARNPMNPHQVSRVSLTPEVVDGIVFWTKNPAPMLPRLDELRDYMYIFQFTITGYDRDVERNLPGKRESIIPTFQRLSDQIGPDRVIWRYDPILIGGRYTESYHLRAFEKLAGLLSPYTQKCTISFLDMYASTKRNLAGLAPGAVSPEQQIRLAKGIGEIARSFGLTVDACAEEGDLTPYGIRRGSCIDGRLFERLLGRGLEIRKDRNQRGACGCMESVDVGAYHTCRNGCLYCYANHSERLVEGNWGRHNPESALLVGELGPEDKVTERKIISLTKKH